MLLAVLAYQLKLRFLDRGPKNEDKDQASSLAISTYTQLKSGRLIAFTSTTLCFFLLSTFYGHRDTIIRGQQNPNITWYFILPALAILIFISTILKFYKKR